MVLKNIRPYIFNKFAIALEGVIVGCLIASFFFLYYVPSSPRGLIVREGQNGLINPILACEVGTSKSFPELEPIQLKIQSSINRITKSGDASEVAVYLRALNSGRWTGVNEDNMFSPASMYKVAIMVAYFKEAETNSRILIKTLQYKSPTTNPPEKTSLILGNFYSVEQLINTMIVDSDNEAMNILIDNADPDSIVEVFKDLNLSVVSKTNQESLDVMSAHDFSLLFRTLYGATYLSREMSNRALEILTKTKFTEGLEAGAPPSTVIAHKFGARTVVPNYGQSNNTPTKELHDCGIVYYPDHPYLLCVMTRGNDFDLLAKAIQDLSRLVYNEMDMFYKQESRR